MCFFIENLHFGKSKIKSEFSKHQLLESVKSKIKKPASLYRLVLMCLIKVYF